MIKAQELRIGNFARVAKNEANSANDDYQIKQLTIEDIALIESGKLLCLGLPLTEAKLLELGFEKQENNWKRLAICNDWSYLFWERLAGVELSVNKHSIMQPHVNHLHQLQNLYKALTNEELILSN